VHRRLGAKMAPFAGWEMPIEYAGTLSEHRAVRAAVGVFDLSHLGKVEVRGDGAHDALQHALAGDLDRLKEAGAAQYTLCLDEHGGIVDDLIVYREQDGYLLVPNAANWPAVAEQVSASAAAGTEVTPHPEVAVIAVQGPRAPELVGGLFGVAGTLAYMHMAPVRYDGVPARVCRTGYTGERGFELLVPGEAAERLWDELFGRGAALGAVPVGLGARDTLRLEMGYALHGNDISTDTDPFEARPRRAGRRQGARPGAGAGRAGLDRPPDPAARHGRAARRATGRRGHQRHLLADPAPRRGHGLRAPRGLRAGHRPAGRRPRPPRRGTGQPPTVRGRLTEVATRSHRAQRARPGTSKAFVRCSSHAPLTVLCP
jgi:glycine cleavage system T protein (aminomethyltransferase)